MVIGTTIFKGQGEPYRTPQFAAGGLSGSLVLDLLNRIGTPTVSAQAQTRNSEDTAWTNIGAATTLTTVDEYPIEFSSCKEWVRIIFSFDAGDGATNGIHFHLRPPTWAPF